MVRYLFKVNKEGFRTLSKVPVEVYFEKVTSHSVLSKNEYCVQISYKDSTAKSDVTTHKLFFLIFDEPQCRLRDSNEDKASLLYTCVTCIPTTHPFRYLFYLAAGHSQLISCDPGHTEAADSRYSEADLGPLQHSRWSAL